jgi:hypothetical protein
MQQEQEQQQGQRQLQHSQQLQGPALGLCAWTYACSKAVCAVIAWQACMRGMGARRQQALLWCMYMSMRTSPVVQNCRCGPLFSSLLRCAVLCSLVSAL